MYKPVRARSARWSTGVRLRQSLWQPWTWSSLMQSPMQYEYRMPPFPPAEWRRDTTESSGFTKKRKSVLSFSQLKKECICLFYFLSFFHRSDKKFVPPSPSSWFRVNPHRPHGRGEQRKRIRDTEEQPPAERARYQKSCTSLNSKRVSVV